MWAWRTIADVFLCPHLLLHFTTMPPLSSTAQDPVPTPLTGAAGFAMPVRVYWEDTDAGGVVFYANYLKFFERARTEWLRVLGVEQQSLRDDTGAIFVVADVTLRYLAAARLDDLLMVSVRVVERGQASMLLEQQALRGDTVLVSGQIRIGCVHADTLKPRRMPAQVLIALDRP
jgi:acyl-CoA thioester hydrolase